MRDRLLHPEAFCTRRPGCSAGAAPCGTRSPDPRGKPRLFSEELLVQIKATAFHCKHTNLPFCDQGCCGFDDSHLIRKSLVVS